MSLLDKRLVYSPFEYNEPYEFWVKQQSAHWLPFDVQLNSDVIDWSERLNESEKAVISRTLKGFTQFEIIVEDYWATKVSRWFKKPEIQMMSSSFASMESIHAVAYAYLQETLGMTDFDAFLYEPTAKARLDRLIGTPGKTKEDIMISLAVFSAFSEGVSLFSSFAILMSFSMRNLLKGVGQIIAYSQRDECYAEGTEVLTPIGWKDLSEITLEDEVAQFHDDGGISFVKPTNKVEYDVDENVYHFTNGANNVDLLVTGGHRMVIQNSNPRYSNFNKIYTQEANQVAYHAYNRHLCAGTHREGKDEITPLERFRIAFQADGSLLDARHTDASCGYLKVSISLKKKRKIERLREILTKAELDWTEVPINNMEWIKFWINAPVDISKDFDWVNLKEVSGEWCKKFIYEMMHWDGHDIHNDNGSSIRYSNIVEKNADKVQAICALGNYQCHRLKSEDNRKESFKDIYRLYIHTKYNGINGTSINKEQVPYKGKVRCLTVPSGMLVVRYNKVVSISGNCLHSEAGCWLFRSMTKEYPEVFTEEVKDKIYEAARLTTQLEDNFIDQSFALGEIEGISSSDLKTYVRSRINLKLKDLGLKSIYKPDKEKLKNLEWISILSSGVELQDFFAGRVTTYAKSVADWSVLYE